MKKASFEILQKFDELHREFDQRYNEKGAKKLLKFFQYPEIFAIFKRYARNNPHPLTHENFKSDWEAEQILSKTRYQEKWSYLFD